MPAMRITAATRERVGQDESYFLETAVGDISAPNAEDIEDKRQLPSIALGLYLAAASIGLDAALESVFAMMEPRLARQLTRFGSL